jgi:hypothetical protein
LAASASYTGIREQAGNLYGFYVRRAERQQTWMDRGSLFTVIGAAGALEGNISDQRRQAWAIAAFVPSIISQLNAYETTRELFEGGALAVKLVTARYDRFMQASQLLSITLEASTPVGDCASISTLVETVAKRREDSKYDAEGVLLAEVRRLKTACLAMKDRSATLRFASDYAGTYKAILVARYADDILTLDEAIASKDRDMRFTPVETLSALIASPLRAADFVITGQDTSAAVAALKTQTAFSGLNRSLAGMTLPTLTSTGSVPVVSPLSEAAVALSGAGSETLKQDVETARSEASRLSQIQLTQAFSEQMAKDLLDAASADYLTFTYDPVTSVTTVMVGPKPVTTGLVTATTASPPKAL